MRGYDISDPRAFPVCLQCNDEFAWKIELNYDRNKQNFAISINGKPFLEMPYQAELLPEGP